MEFVGREYEESLGQLEPILQIKGASKTYKRPDGAASIALQPVTATLQRGEFVSLLGPSGCGKTTLLKMCAGLIPVSSGSIALTATGQPVKPGSYGFVFQSPALLPWRTVLSNVLLPADILHLPMNKARERALALLELVQLSHAVEKRPSELSGGMQQRVAIARALLHDPSLLFLDEPFGALDAMTREELNLQLQDIQISQNKTVVFVTHDIEEAILLSDRILVMSSGPGRLVADITVPLPKPRKMADKKNPVFYELAERIRSLLGRDA